MNGAHRLAADAGHQFGGIELDRNRPLTFRLDGRRIAGFAGDTVLSAVLASGVDTLGTLEGAPLALTARFYPQVSIKGGPPLPMDRVPAVDGLDLVTIGRRRSGLGQPPSLRHLLDVAAEPAWLHDTPTSTLDTDLLVIGGGVAGLAAAEAAAASGRKVVLVERRPWLGGDARYFGAVGDEESPEALTTRLAAALAANPDVTLLRRAEAFALSGGTALVHVVDTEPLAGRVLAIAARQVVLATGATQRLPVFSGNRAPGVLPAIEAYHLAKRYGVSLGSSAIVATQGNHGYRLALRLHDAGVTIRRVVDSRVAAQSRFIDFAKASGLNLASGQYPLSADKGRFSFANTNTLAVSATLEADQLIVGGSWQPDLVLWMLAGGGVHWSEDRRALVATGALDHVTLAGAAAGYRSMRACAESGRIAQAPPLPTGAQPIEDSEQGTHLETPDGPMPAAPPHADLASFLDSGSSLARRLAPDARQRRPAAEPHALSLADVAASVDLGLILPADAGTIAAERGAPGGKLVASEWKPAPREMPADPIWLAERFGAAPQRVHLVVDEHRTFEIGALVYSNTARREPGQAAGVVVETAPVGGIALIDGAVLARGDRFIVETQRGPSPARLR